MFKKGQYVRHPNVEIHDKWGLGIVTEDSIGNEVSVFFEKVQAMKILSTQLVEPTVIDNPDTSTTYLDNAIYKKTAPSKYQEIINQFLADFPGGLHGEMYLKYERNYKVEASNFFKETLAKEKFSELLENHDFEILASIIKKAYQTNLLASFEQIKLSEALKLPENIKVVSENLFDLLFGEEEVGQRLYKVAKNLKFLELDKWPTLTYPLFMMFPDKYMFVKPNLTKAAAQKRGFDIQYDSQINPTTYKRVLLFSEDLENLLNADGRDEFKPRDMIDIQGFMWCSYGEGWSKEEIERTKAEFN